MRTPLLASFALVVGLAGLPADFHPARAAALADSLKQALEAQGWIATETPEGTVYHPPGSGTGKAAASPTAQATDTSLEKALRARGWRVERAADGSLVLYPPSRQAQPGSRTASPETQTSLPPEAGGLQHWRVQRTADGGWLFVPRSTGASAGGPASTSNPGNGSSGDDAENAQQNNGSRTDLLAPCPGLKLSEVHVRLPVNTWSEAHNLGRAWVRAAGLDHKATVGRIREILRVYLVSIVTRERPHRLLHQLAIRRNDGSVIVLN
ncbi:MAG TPA: hypothetical protein ENK62_06995 [Chromatiales bacterium]|nr:hypothetical protein [Chromatiales bacterium]